MPYPSTLATQSREGKGGLFTYIFIWWESLSFNLSFTIHFHKQKFPLNLYLMINFLELQCSQFHKVVESKYHFLIQLTTPRRQLNAVCLPLKALEWRWSHIDTKWDGVTMTIYNEFVNWPWKDRTGLVKFHVTTWFKVSSRVPNVTG